MDLFDYMRENQKDDDSPLAKRMRPESLDEVIGQEHIIGKEKLLYRAIKADKLSSLIFYGPPGTGKTTLAMVIARAVLTEHGLRLSGLSPDGRIVEMCELTEHPFFVATQGHPELKSRPNRPHPLFKGFVEAALENKHRK